MPHFAPRRRDRLVERLDFLRAHKSPSSSPFALHVDRHHQRLAALQEIAVLGQQSRRTP